MPPAAQAYNVWMENDSPRFVLDCLLPTGIIIPLTVEKDATVEEIKEVSFIIDHLLSYILISSKKWV